jgi:hypothetical protein
MELKDIVEIIEERLAIYFLKEENCKLVNIKDAQIVKRPFSSLIFMAVKTSGSERKLVAKTIVHHEINKSITEKENQAMVEYEILKHLYPKFINVKNCAVPKPVLIIPEIETYLMDFFEGVLLVDMHKYLRYLSSSEEFKKLKKYYFLLGKWLRNFQEFTETNFESIESLNGVLERFYHRLNLIQQANNPLIPSDLKSKSTGMIENWIKSLNPEKILVAGRHGDFGAWNTLVSPNSLTVIDFLGYAREPIPVDIIKVLVYLEDEKFSLTSNPRRVDVLIKNFIAGYGGFPSISKPLIFITEAMQRIVSLWGNLSNDTDYFHHKIENNLRIKNHLTWFSGGYHRKSVWSV